MWFFSCLWTLSSRERGIMPLANNVHMDLHVPVGEWGSDKNRGDRWGNRVPQQLRASIWPAHDWEGWQIIFDLLKLTLPSSLKCQSRLWNYMSILFCRFFGAQSLKVAMTHHLVARAHSCRGDFRSAITCEKEAYNIYKEHVRKSKQFLQYKLCLRENF